MSRHRHAAEARPATEETDKVSTPIRLRRLLPAGLLALAALLLFAGSASANSPWWHLVSNSRPTFLAAGAGHPGVPGEPEVQEIRVPLVEELGPYTEQGGFVLTVGSGAEEQNLGLFSTEPLAAEEGFTPLDAAHLKAALEVPYGAGKVQVTETGEAGLLKFTVESPASKLQIAVGEIFSPEPTAKVLNPGTPGTPAVPDGEIYLTAANLGDASFEGSKGQITLTDTLPQGLRPTEVVASRPEGANFQARLSIPCEPIAGQTVTCHYSGAVLPYDALEMRIAVDLEPGAHTGELNQLTVAGASAPAATKSAPITVSSAPVPFGVDEYEQSLEEEGGAPATQAGAHPFQYTTQITVDQLRNTEPFGESDGTALRPEVRPAGIAKDFAFKLPAGLIGSATTIPQCTIAQFFGGVGASGSEANECPNDTAVGVALVTVHEPATVQTSTLTLPIFNLEPNFGEPARFGFYAILANTPVFIDTSVRSGTDYGITAGVNNLTQTASVLASTATFWGTPGDPRHDGQRGFGCLLSARGETGQTCLPLGESAPRPLLTMPTQCTSPLRAEGELDQWNIDQGLFSPFSGPFSPAGLLSGCNRVPFSPTFAAQPTEKAAAAPTGLTVDLNLKQEGLNNSAGLGESDIKRVTVALPTGITTNPAVANGLSACSLAQYNAEALGVQSCPESSKVGEVEIESPLVKQTIVGSVYVAKQHDNPANNLLSIYVVAKNPELGVLVKTAGAVTPNPQTGQLTTTFDELPQLPFTHFHFAFRSGPRAPLATPNLCGTYTTGADLYPYSAPTAPLHRDATFTVSAGAGGGACATQESQLPNKPTLEAGTVTPIAGAYSPLVFKVRRADGSQTLSSIEATLPEGLLGKLAGVKECSNAAIAQATSRSGEGQGALELASPSCPASSQVGVVNVGTGVGTQPYYVQGKAYLAGPYKGAPLSLAIITPAVVGPFDLGTIVVRTALYVNETSAQITAKSDPIPTIVHGLPTVVQSIALNMNRPSFTLNPTSCEPKQITGQAISTLGAVAPLQERFQVGACGALGFKPSLKLSLKGATKRSGVPALKAVLTYPKGNYANIKSVSTVLPKSEFIDNAHIGNTCTRVQFNAGAGQGAECPKRSVLGHAKAWSPLLDNPLEGTVYLRSNGGERELPDIVAALKGQIPVTLVGFIDSVRKNKNSEVSRLRTRFQNVPDAPVSRFVLQLAGAKHGLLENSANLCKVKNIAQVKAVAQNGKTYDTEPAVGNDCGKRGKGKKSKSGKKK